MQYGLQITLEVVFLTTCQVLESVGKTSLYIFLRIACICNGDTSAARRQFNKIHLIFGPFAKQGRKLCQTHLIMNFVMCEQE